MPVTHDLYQDLKLSKEEIQQKNAPRIRYWIH